MEQLGHRTVIIEKEPTYAPFVSVPGLKVSSEIQRLVSLFNLYDHRIIQGSTRRIRSYIILQKKEKKHRGAHKTIALAVIELPKCSKDTNRFTWKISNLKKLSQFAQLEKCSLHFLSSSFVIHANRLHP